MKKPVFELLSDGVCRVPPEEARQDEAQESLEPPEQEAEVLAGAGEQGIDLVAMAPFEVIAAEMAVGLEVPDDRLDGGPSPEFPFDDAEDAALLS